MRMYILINVHNYFNIAARKMYETRNKHRNMFNINIALKRGVAEHGESCAHKKRENKSKKRRHA